MLVNYTQYIMQYIIFGSKSLQHNLFEPFSAFVLVILKPKVPTSSILHKMVNLVDLKEKNHLNNQC